MKPSMGRKRSKNFWIQDICSVTRMAVTRMDSIPITISGRVFKKWFFYVMLSQTAVEAIKQRRIQGKKERMKEGNEGVRLVAVSGQHPSALC